MLSPAPPPPSACPAAGPASAASHSQGCSSASGASWGAEPAAPPPDADAVQDSDGWVSISPFGYVEVRSSRAASDRHEAQSSCPPPEPVRPPPPGMSESFALEMQVSPARGRAHCCALLKERARLLKGSAGAALRRVRRLCGAVLRDIVAPSALLGAGSAEPGLHDRQEQAHLLRAGRPWQVRRSRRCCGCAPAACRSAVAPMRPALPLLYNKCLAAACCSGIRFPKHRRGSRLQRFLGRLRSCFLPRAQLEAERSMGRGSAFGTPIVAGATLDQVRVGVWRRCLVGLLVQAVSAALLGSTALAGCVIALTRPSPCPLYAAGPQPRCVAAAGHSAGAPAAQHGGLARRGPLAGRVHSSHAHLCAALADRLAPTR